MTTENHNTGKEHAVTIHVNNKPVEVMGPKATGSEIKSAAVNAGLSVKQDFVLSQEHENDNLTRIGDNDVITVNPQGRFLMVSPDHNS